MPRAGVVLSLLLCFLLPGRSAGQVPEDPFARRFTGEAMRVDYFHSGMAETETVSLDAAVVEGAWPGSRKHLTDWPDFGKYRFGVTDQATGELLFSQSYSTLFGEWQTTEEARSIARTFHESVRFPRPKAPFVLRITTHDAKWNVKEVFKQAVDPDSHLVQRLPAWRSIEVISAGDHATGNIPAEIGDLPTEAGNVPVETGNVLADTVGGPAAPGNVLDVVVLADGYTVAQAEKARRDFARFSQVFLATQPFDRFKDRIAIRAVLAFSDQTGPDEPRKFVHKHSALGTSFNTFDSERYLTTLENKAMRELAAQVPYDTIYVMVNSSRYGGAGVYNLFSVFVTDNEYDEYVFIHEFGHGFAGLGDEYYDSAVAYSEFYPKGTEPPEPNVTAMLQGPSKLKWKDLCTPGVPIPTPNEAAYAGKVGAFEGAGYSAKGLYRPALDCRMMSKKRQEFCPVCTEAVEDAIEMYLE